MALTAKGAINEFEKLGFKPAPGEVMQEVYVIRRAKSAPLPEAGSDAWRFLDSIANATERKYRLLLLTDRRLVIAAMSVWRGRPKGELTEVVAAELGDSFGDPERAGRWSGQADWPLVFADGSQATLQAMTHKMWTSMVVAAAV